MMYHDTNRIHLSLPVQVSGQVGGLVDREHQFIESGKGSGVVLNRAKRHYSEVVEAEIHIYTIMCNFCEELMQ